MCNLFTIDQQTQTVKVPSLYEAAERARVDWQNALQYFEAVTEEELIDYAAYSAKAAERKYMYLLKKIKLEYYKGDEVYGGCREFIY